MYPGAYEYRPVAWNGGVGFWGHNLKIPYNIQTKLALRIKNQKANLAITLAQYRELTTLFTSFASEVLGMFATVQRLKDPRNFLRSYLRAYKRKKRGLAPEVNPLVKGASAVYLGYMFGLRQFADDFSAVSESLRRRFEDPMYLTLDPMSFHERQYTSRKGGTGNERWACETADLLSTRVKARYRVFPNDQVLAQMGMTNLPALVYDFIPFSFVLNWLIPLGTYLATLDALQGVTDLRWYYTTKRTQQSFVTFPAWGDAKATYLWEEVARSGVKTELKPPFPRFELSKNASNVVTAVALLGALRKNTAVERTIVRIR